ncbi:UDP-N-acetylmuramate dehydrogenase [Baaleninema simplex]|uniref:UDP-N-acetylmuramate dehydrogenase n=1 Tax=Baaleninema simplex TaxID=2862350 RepID=UPI00034AA12A|nr:UDP-N-acetylmuramate dehydrogenase [Baaleninema simplex]
MTDDLDRSPIRLLGSEAPIYRQVSLTRMTTLRVGGPAQWYVTPRHLDDLHAAVSWARSEGFPVTLLGAGSNLLIGDKGIPGLVVSTRYLRETAFETDGRVRVAAGVPLPKLAWQIADRGWSGFEWAVGIPGTVGGAVVMNAGAHRSCTADVVASVEVLSAEGRLEVLKLEDLQYGYRHSVLQGSDRTVLGATFALRVGDDPLCVKARTESHLKQRHASQPYHRPSCGSVFRNPTPQAAGWLIEQSGLKGYTVGGACVAQEHANFILNCGRATADDVVSVIRHVRRTVCDRWGVWLEPEVKLLGEFSRDYDDLW